MFSMRRTAGRLAVSVGLATGIVFGWAAPAHAVWSIGVVDPATGVVAIATAGCVDDVIELGEIVPGRGAVLSQSTFDPSIMVRAAALVGADSTPDEVIEDITRDLFDPDTETRQHAVVTTEGPSATFTGSEPAGQAEAEMESVRGYEVVVLGDRLAKEGTVGEILDAFDADIGEVDLADRLMRALEAGSATGGDVDCNTRTYSQTARAAAIRIAQPDDRPDQPSVDLRVESVVGGPNPLLTLRTDYDAWRAENGTDCPDCDLDALEVPPGGTAGEGELGGFEFILGLGTIAAFLVLWFKRRYGGQNDA